MAEDTATTGDEEKDSNINKLSPLQSMRLMVFLDTQRDRLIRDRMKLVDIAKEATEHLKFPFPITAGMVAFRLKELEIEIPRPAPTDARGGWASRKEGMRKAKETAEQAMTEVKRLEEEMIDLKARLDRRFEQLDNEYNREKSERQKLEARLAHLEKALGVAQIDGAVRDTVRKKL